MEILKNNKTIGFKYCYEKFNPKNGCNTLALGTTRYFRWQYKENRNLINDPYEGLAQVQVGDKVLGGKIAPSNYIYCMTSKYLSLEEASNAFQINYDSYFKIKDISEFYNYLLQCLSKQLKIEDFIPKIESDPYIVDCFNTRNIFVWLLSGKVEYYSMEDFNGHPGIRIGISDFNNMHERIGVSNLVKPIEYKNQHELRGIFVPCVNSNELMPSSQKSMNADISNMPEGNLFLEVKDIQKIIDVPDILDYIQ